MKLNKQKLKTFFKKLFFLVLNPRFILCFGIAWIVTNGWSYILLGLGTFFGNEWMLGIASGYLALMWLPFTPEKIITVAIAIFLLKLIFPNDKKTLGVLHDMHMSAKAKREQRKQSDRSKETKKENF